MDADGANRAIQDLVEATNLASAAYDGGPSNHAQLGIVQAETFTGGIRLRISLLTAGFVIGAGGSSIRDLSIQTSVSIRSYNEVAEVGGQPQRVRTLVLEGLPTCLLHAFLILEAAAERYRDLCGGSLAGAMVPRRQLIHGVGFYYQPPPRAAVPQAAVLAPSAYRERSAAAQAGVSDRTVARAARGARQAARAARASAETQVRLDDALAPGGGFEACGPAADLGAGFAGARGATVAGAGSFPYETLAPLGGYEAAGGYTATDASLLASAIARVTVGRGSAPSPCPSPFAPEDARAAARARLRRPSAPDAQSSLGAEPHFGNCHSPLDTSPTTCSLTDRVGSQPPALRGDGGTGAVGELSASLAATHLGGDGQPAGGRAAGLSHYDALVVPRAAGRASGSPSYGANPAGSPDTVEIYGSPPSGDAPYGGNPALGATATPYAPPPQQAQILQLLQTMQAHGVSASTLQAALGILGSSSVQPPPPPPPPPPPAGDGAAIDGGSLAQLLALIAGAAAGVQPPPGAASGLPYPAGAPHSVFGRGPIVPRGGGSPTDARPPSGGKAPLGAEDFGGYGRSTLDGSGASQPLPISTSSSCPSSHSSTSVGAPSYAALPGAHGARGGETSGVALEAGAERAPSVPRSLRTPPPLREHVSAFDEETCAGLP